MTTLPPIAKCAWCEREFVWLNPKKKRHIDNFPRMIVDSANPRERRFGKRRCGGPIEMLRRDVAAGKGLLGRLSPAALERVRLEASRCDDTEADGVSSQP